MPTITQAITVNTTLISPSETNAGWGVGALVGISTAATKNTAKQYTSLAALKTDHGTDTDIGLAGASIFAQGVESVYTVSIDAVAATPTPTELTAALNAILNAENAGNIKAVALAGIYSDSSTLTAALKTWADANDRIFVVSNPIAASVGGIVTAAEALASNRGFFAAHNTAADAESTEDPAAAALGVIMSADPGDTMAWAQINISGVDDYLPTDVATLEAARVNCIADLQNTSVMRFTNGLTLTTDPQDPAQYIDTTITRMYITDTLRNRIAAYRLSVRKVPFTTAGIEYVRSELIAAMAELEAAGVISDYAVTMPRISDISAAAKSSRILSGVSVWCATPGNAQEFVINMTMEAI